MGVYDPAAGAGGVPGTWSGGVLTGSGLAPGFAPDPTFEGTTILTGQANKTVLASAGFSLTGANTASLVDLAGAWNTSGVTTAFRMAITDTDVGAGSLLMDLLRNGTSEFKVAKGGDVTAAGAIITSATGFFSHATRGRIYAPNNGVIRLTNGTGSDFTRLVFGIADTSRPALQVNGAILETRLGDGSALAQHRMSILGITDGVAAPSAVEGMVLLFADSADGDLKVIYGDGTVKTIVMDT